MLVARLSTKAGNKMIDDPNGIKPLKDYIDNVKPEVAYFSESCGNRTFYIVVDIPSADMIPPMVEPLYHLGATVEIRPAMVLDDLTKAMESLKSS